jgi:hypothetical protein
VGMHEEGKKKQKIYNIFFALVGGGWENENELSQICLIRRKRVLTIGPSFAQCRFARIRHPTLTRNGAEVSLIHSQTVKSHG